MYNLIITKIKYPKNETIIFEYSNFDNLTKELKEMILKNKINKNDIIRIEKEK